MSSSVDQIKSKLDIVSVVGGYVKLEKSGSNFKARCPFHNEKTPSFFVSIDRGTFYCFGCGAKGDIFTFIENFEGLDFKGALKVLAERAGVKLENFWESFSENLLEHPQYTRPSIYKNLPVPQTLMSGHHEKIKQWKKEHSKQTTKKLRPDLLKKVS